MAVKASDIDYVKILDNVNQMIHIQEFDSMRSAGKAKMNAANLNDLYTMKARYEKMVKAPAKKEA